LWTSFAKKFRERKLLLPSKIMKNPQRRTMSSTGSTVHYPATGPGTRGGAVKTVGSIFSDRGTAPGTIRAQPMERMGMADRGQALVGTGRCVHRRARFLAHPPRPCSQLFRCVTQSALPTLLFALSCWIPRRDPRRKRGAGRRLPL